MDDGKWRFGMMSPNDLRRILRDVGDGRLDIRKVRGLAELARLCLRMAMNWHQRNGREYETDDHREQSEVGSPCARVPGGSRHLFQYRCFSRSGRKPIYRFPAEPCPTAATSPSPGHGAAWSDSQHASTPSNALSGIHRRSSGANAAHFPILLPVVLPASGASHPRSLETSVSTHGVSAPARDLETVAAVRATG